MRGAKGSSTGSHPRPPLPPGRSVSSVSGAEGERSRGGECIRLLIITTVFALFLGATAWDWRPPSPPRTVFSQEGGRSIHREPAGVATKVQKKDASAREDELDTGTGNPKYELLLPLPTVLPHIPSHILRALKELPLSEGKQKGNSNGVTAAAVAVDNSVAVTQEEIEAARRSFVYPLPSHVDFMNGRKRGANLFAIVAAFVQDAQVDPAPIVVDYGCSSVGQHFAAEHDNATLLCLHPSTKIANTTTDEGRPSVSKNALHIGVDTFTDRPFTHFYTSCNLVSTSLILEVPPPLLLFSEGVPDCTSVLAHLALVLPMSKTTVVAMPSNCVAKLSTSVKQLQHAEFQITPVAVKHKETPSAVTIVVVTTLRTTRQCAKTFGAPMEQWDRKMIMEYEKGVVRFRVEGKGDLARTIHPLQYIPSVNLDTVLGLGVSPSATGKRLLGQTIATPRYSDPLPHNWVIAGGGRLNRIDKVDLRYDRKVDESKGYWGRSTRGYFHLLGYHLCLPLDPTGLPRAALSAACTPSCVKCVTDCSYLPKGTGPCSHCVKCGRCIESEALTEEEERAHYPPVVQPMCQKTYPSMHGARKVWAKWEKSDGQRPLPKSV